MDATISSKLRSAYKNMMDRCYRPNHPKFADYGGRGITVCKEWRESRLNFVKYVQTLDDWDNPDYEFDRIDVNGLYEPGNIRLVTPIINRQNKRPRATHGAYNELFRKYHKLLITHDAMCKKHNESIDDLDIEFDLLMMKTI